jgi:hypothetical protein
MTKAAAVSLNKVHWRTSGNGHSLGDREAMLMMQPHRYSSSIGSLQQACFRPDSYIQLRHRQMMNYLPPATTATALTHERHYGWEQSDTRHPAANADNSQGYQPAACSRSYPSSKFGRYPEDDGRWRSDHSYSGYESYATGSGLRADCCSSEEAFDDDTNGKRQWQESWKVAESVFAENSSSIRPCADVQICDEETTADGRARLDTPESPRRQQSSKRRLPEKVRLTWDAGSCQYAGNHQREPKK